MSTGGASAPYDSTMADSARRIAQAKTAAAAVDHNGRPTRQPATFTYDAAGRLVSASTEAGGSGE